MARIAPSNPSAFPTFDLHGWRKCIMPAWSRHCHVGQMSECSGEQDVRERLRFLFMIAQRTGLLQIPSPP